MANFCLEILISLNFLKNRNFLEICLENRNFLVKLPEEIDIFRKFAWKN